MRRFWNKYPDKEMPWILSVTLTEEKYDELTQDIHSTRMYLVKNDLPWLFRKVPFLPTWHLFARQMCSHIGHGPASGVTRVVLCVVAVLPGLFCAVMGRGKLNMYRTLDHEFGQAPLEDLVDQHSWQFGTQRLGRSVRSHCP